MSTNVDNQVVRLRLENQQYEQAIKKSIQSTQNLKNSLNFDGADKGLEQLTKTAKEVSFDPLSKSVEYVTKKFTALEIAGITALTRIVNKAMDAGEKLVKSLSTDQISQGFGEYELKLDSIQTIMAGTGESLQTVSEYLDELNTYADKTIYSFSDMTSNIGKFTNAGVKLGPAVAAIQGISNAAALAGANSQQASHAMYNFAQALSSGYVKLIDWKSIEVANMATAEFKQQLLDTAVAVGTLTKGADGLYRTMSGHAFSATRDFNEYLKDAWMTTDVLVKTLGNYADETTDIGKRAFAAAQDVKTFTQLIDTMKEAVGSGWATTFETIIGNFDEAKRFFTWINNELGTLIENSSKQRNETLKEWKELGGRAEVLKIIFNLYAAIRDVLHGINSAFREVFPYMSGEKLYNATKRFREFTDQLELTDDMVWNIYRSFRGLFSIISLVGTGVKKLISAGFNLISGIFGAVSDDVLELTGNLGDMIYYFSEWIKSLEILDKAAYGIGMTIKIVVGLIASLAEQITKIPGFDILVDSIYDLTNALGRDLETLFSKIGNVIKKFIDRLKDLDEISFDSIVSEFIDFISKLRDGEISFKDIFKNTTEKFNAFYNAFMNGISNILEKLPVVQETFIKVFKKIKEFTDNFDFGALFVVAFSLVLMQFLRRLGNFLVTFSDLVDGIGEIISSFKNVLKSLDALLKAYKIKIYAQTFKELAIGIAILAGAIALLAQLDTEKMQQAMDVVFVLGAVLIAMMGVLAKIESKVKATDIAKVVLSIATLSISLLPLAAAFNILAGIRTDKILQSILMFIVAVTALGGLTFVITKYSGEAVKSIPGMIALSIAVYTMALAFNQISKINFGNILQSITVFISVVGALVVLSLVSKTVQVGAFKGMLGAATSLWIFALALKKLTKIDMDKIMDNLGGLIAIIVMFQAVIKASSLAGVNSAKAGVAVLAMSTGLLIMASAIKKLGKIKTSDINAATESVGAIIVLFTLFTAISRFAGPNSSKASLAILSMSIGITLLSAAVAGLSILKPESVDHAVSAVVKMQAMFAILVASTALVKNGKKTIIAISTAMMAMTAMLGVMTLLDPDKMNGALKVISVLAILLAGIIAVTHFVKEATKTILAISGVMAIMAGLVALLSFINADVAVKNCISLGALVTAVSILAIAVGKVPTSPSALIKGTAALAGILAALTAVVAIIGAIVLGLESININAIDVINKGADFLAALGKAVGRFVGSIVGGLMEGVTSGLPEVGASLSAFAENMKPFYDVMANVPEGALSGALKTVEIILAFTAANFLDGLARFFTGGRDLATFAEQLVPFARALKEYGEEIKDLNVDAIEKTNEAIRLILDIAQSAPKFGGLIQAFTGKLDLEKLGEQLRKFASQMVQYSNIMSIFKSSTVTSNKEALETIMAISNSAPKFGGLKFLLSGGIDLPRLGKQLKDFATPLVEYSQIMSNFIPDSILNSNKAVNMLIDMSNNFPKVSALSLLFGGFSDISLFGSQLKDFASSMVLYSETISMVNVDAIKKTNEVIKVLINLANNLPMVTSILGSLFNDQQMSFSKLGEELFALGNSLYSYSESITSVDTNKINLVTDSLKKLIEVLSSLQNVDSFEVYQLCASIGHMVDSGLANGIIEGKESIEAAGELGDEVISTLSKHLGITGNSYSRFAEQSGIFVWKGLNHGLASDVGKNTLIGTAKGLGDLVISSLNKALGVNSPSIFAELAGKYVDEGLIIGVESEADKAAQVFYQAGANCMQALDNGLAGIAKINGKRADAVKYKAAEVASRNFIGSLKNSLKSSFDSIFKPDLEKVTDEITSTLTDNLSTGGFDAGSNMVSSAGKGIKNNSSATKAATDKGKEIADAFQKEIDKIGISESIRGKEYDLWEASLGIQNDKATEAEKAARELEINKKKMEKLQGDAEDKQKRVQLTYDEYTRIAKEYGKDSDEERKAYEQYLDEQISLQNVLNEIQTLQNEITKTTETSMKTTRDQYQTYFDYLSKYSANLKDLGLTMQEIDSLARKEAGMPEEITTPKNAVSSIETITTATKQIIGNVNNTVKGMEDKGEALDATLSEGIKNNAPEVINEVDNINEANADAIESQQEVWESLGGKLVDNLADGMKSKATIAAQTALDVMDSAWKAAMLALGDKSDPLGVSVVQTSQSNYTRGKYSPGTSAQYRIEYEGTQFKVGESAYLAWAADRVTNGHSVTIKEPTGSTPSTTINLTQINNSPKALSSSEIYRNTKNAFSTFAGKVTAPT